jgi:hypothetical protein
MLLIAIIVAFLVLLIASITDLKNREVPDYVSYALVFIAFAISLLNTLIEWDYAYIAQSIMGFAVGLIIAYLMFYLGQWGGGDSKLLMGIGAVIGFNIFPLFGENNYWLLIFIGNIVLFGAVYGLVWSIFLAIKHRRTFVKGFGFWVRKREIMIARRVMFALIALLFLVALVFVAREYQLPILLFIVMLYMMFYIWILVKTIEETCMIKDVPVSKLTEGDWIYKDVYVGKKFMTGPKDLGISREQIELLKRYAAKGKIRTVKIKEGIPFIPAFLLAYVATIVMYYLGVF